MGSLDMMLNESLDMMLNEWEDDEESGDDASESEDEHIRPMKRARYGGA